MAKKTKKGSVVTLLKSKSGYAYVTKKKDAVKLTLRKFDPYLRKHCTFKA